MFPKRPIFNIKFLSALSIWAALAVLPVYAAQTLPSAEYPSAISLAPSTKVYIPIHLTIPDKGYIYSNPKGPGIGKPLVIEVATEIELTSQSVLTSPSVKYIPSEGEYVNIYRQKAVFYIPVLSSPEFTQSAISIRITGLMCDDTSCKPFEQKLIITAEAGNLSSGLLTAPPSNTSPLGSIASSSENIIPDSQEKTSADVSMQFYPRYISKIITGVLPAILLGFLAGLILNLMPCVLPVLSLKIMSLVHHAQKSSALKQSGLAYTAGILVSFTVLALLSSFAGWGWGSLFQNSDFIIIIILILFMLSLSLFGIYQMNVPGFAGRAVSHSFHSLNADSFVKGTLAALLATPCSGPLLGAALAWSLTMQWYIVLAVFLSIGTGMAFPYLAISFRPSLVSFIPKPGPWMVPFERIMGFLLAGSVIYFTSILDADYFIPISIMLFISAFGLWQFGILGNKAQQSGKRIISGSVLVLLTVIALYIPLTHKQAPSAAETHFTRSALTEASRQGRISIVYFTADWCPNCKLSEKTALDTDTVKNLILEYNAQLFKADITLPGTDAEKLLKELGGSAIPFIAVFPAGKNFSSPVCIRDLYTKDDIKRALKEAAE